MRTTYRRAWAFILALSIGLSACGGGAATVVDRGESKAAIVVAAAGALTLPAEVTSARVAELYDSGEIAIIDVREAWEYDQGHIPGATLIPLDRLMGRLDEVPTDLPVVLVCRSANRSGQAYRALVQQGFDNVSNMLGGMLAWEAAGYTIAR